MYGLLVVWTVIILIPPVVLAVATFQDDCWSITSVTLWSGAGRLAIYVVISFRLDAGWRAFVKNKEMIDDQIASLFAQRIVQPSQDTDD